MNYVFLAYIGIVLISTLRVPAKIGQTPKPTTRGEAVATVIFGAMLTLFLLAVYATYMVP